MMMKHHRRELIGLIIYIVIFGIFLVASIISYFKSYQLIDIGLSAGTMNLVIAFLSIAGLVRAIWHATHY